MIVDRVETGIKGFDKLIEGGLPKGSNVLLTGLPGSGKTIFGLQYLVHGAMHNQNGVYVTLDASLEKLKTQAKQFGWDLDKLENDGKISFISLPMAKTKLDLFYLIKDAVEKNGAKRLVFDNLATFAINLDLLAIPTGYAGNIASLVEVKIKGIEGLEEIPTDKFEKVHYTGNPEKRLIYLVIEEMSRIGTTNLIITYAKPEENQVTIDGVSEFVCDGVIIMDIQQIAKKAVRSIKTQKMRYTKHELDSFALTISNNGLVVEEETVFAGSKISGINP